MISSIKSFINTLKSSDNLNIDKERYTLTFPSQNNAPLINELTNFNINIDEVGHGKHEINLDDLPFIFFQNRNDFLERISRNSWSKSIFSFEEDIYYSIENDETYKSWFSTKDYYLIRNNYFAYKLLLFLKTQEHNENSAFYFVDYMNWDTYHLVLTSLKKDGKIEVLLPKAGIDIDENINLPSSVKEFISSFEENNKHFPKFIKAELIGCLSKVEKRKRANILFMKLEEIMYLASQNFEIYIHDLSIENLKKDFIEYKNKYFIQLRDILSKLTSQLISLPIAIGAAAFSTYKVSDSNYTILLILVVFLLYIGYTIFLLKLQREDIEDIKLSFATDFRNLGESPFFIRFPNELKEFKKTKYNLESRISSLIQAIDVYFMLFTISSACFIIYLENQLKISFIGIFWTSLILIVGLTSIYIFNRTLLKDE